jgi:hypothetical protein
MPIPTFLSHLPRAGALPIPYFVAIDPVTGKADFRMAELRKRELSHKYKNCAICGRPVGEVSWLIMGPMGLQNRVSSDTWMHEVCARYSLAACPYLARQQFERRMDYPAGAIETQHVLVEKPTEMFLVKTDKYVLINPGDGYKLINFRPVGWERYHYVGGQLAPDGQGYQRAPLVVSWRHE